MPPKHSTRAGGAVTSFGRFNITFCGAVFRALAFSWPRTQNYSIFSLRQPNTVEKQDQNAITKDLHLYTKQLLKQTSGGLL